MGGTSTDAGILRELADLDRRRLSGAPLPSPVELDGWPALRRRLERERGSAPRRTPDLAAVMDAAAAGSA